MEWDITERRIADQCLRVRFWVTAVTTDRVRQWLSNCASRCPGASFHFSKGVAEYFGFVPLSPGFIASKEL